jgi:hypothetical protein
MIYTNYNIEDYYEDQDVGRWIILKWIFRDRMGWYGLDRYGSGEQPVEGSCGNGNEPSCSITFLGIS